MVFGSNIYESTFGFGSNSDYEPDLEFVKEMECTSLIEGAYKCVYETECNYARLMEAVGIAELTYFVETGNDIINEAGYGESFFDKVKKFFKTILEKIASIFKKFIAIIDSYVKSDKDFVNKYKKLLIKVNTKDFEYNGYEFTNMDYSIKDVSDKMKDKINSFFKVKNYTAAGTKGMNGSDTLLNEDITKFEDEKEKYENMIRNCAFSDGSSQTEASELSEELFKYFRKGENSPITIDKVDAYKLCDTIVAYKDIKNSATKAYNDLKKSVNDNIKEIENKEKEYLKFIPGDKEDKDRDSKSKYASLVIKHISKRVSIQKTQLSVLQIANGAYLSALKDQNRQAKAVCVKLLTYKPKTEGYMYEGEGYKDIFGNVDFR